MTAASVCVSHGAFLSTLIEFYTLLDDLAILPPTSQIHWPSASTGVHPPTIFNADAATAAGHDADAVALLSVMPHLGYHNVGQDFEVRSSTWPASYLGNDTDEGVFEFLRTMHPGDDVMPASAIKLTHGEGVHGHMYIYDTATKLMICWHPSADDDSNGLDYLHLPGKPPAGVMAPIIHGYRTLKYLGLPDRVEHEDHKDEEPPIEWREDLRQQYRKENKVWKAVRKLKDVYLECGWDVNAVEQKDFRKAEYVERRTKYLREVVEPLERQAWPNTPTWSDMETDRV